MFSIMVILYHFIQIVVIIISAISAAIFKSWNQIKIVIIFSSKSNRAKYSLIFGSNTIKKFDIWINQSLIQLIYLALKI